MRRPAALLALLAMALNALWPLIAQAQPKDPLLQVVICSSEGGSHTADLGGKPAGAPDGHQHCTLCAIGADRFPVGPANPVLAIHALSFESARLFVSTTDRFQSTTSLPTPPRGPPAIL